jgi:hypothetical protein
MAKLEGKDENMKTFLKISAQQGSNPVQIQIERASKKP